MCRVSLISHDLLCAGFPVMPATHYIPWLTVCRVSRHAFHSLYPIACRVQGFPSRLSLTVSHGLPCAGFPVMSSTHYIPWLTVCRVSRHAFHSLYPIACRGQGFPSRLSLTVSHGLPCAGFPVMPSTHCIPWLTICRVTPHSLYPDFHSLHSIAEFPGHSLYYIA